MVQKRVLIVGDSPRLQTGFARVNQRAAKAFQDAGWEVAAVQGLTKEQPPTNPENGIKYFTPGDGDDAMARRTVYVATHDWKPDLVYHTGDPGNLTAYASALPENTPLLGYIPIEGEPIVNNIWRTVLKAIPFFTCSKYASDLVQKQLGVDAPWVYHGVNHDVYKVDGSRDAVRKAMKWDDKFVIMTVANNVRRKQLPRLIEAVSILKHHYKVKDIVLYMHTVPNQGHWLEGHNLFDIVRMYDVADIVQFHPNMQDLHSNIPETSNDPNDPGLAQLYNAADVFVLPSQVEGFGLPIAEAMACGLPVIVTKYAAGWEVASPAGRGIPVHDWEVHKSGTRYANTNPSDIAKEILRLIRSPKDRQRMSEAGLERVKAFQWEAFDAMLIEQADKVVDEVRRRAAQAENQNTKAFEESRRVLQPEDAQDSKARRRGIEGQGSHPDGTSSQDDAGTQQA